MPAKGRKPTAGAAVKKPKKVNGYHMAPPIRLGQVITDKLQKKKWRIGPSLGTGGFGEIYSAAEIADGSPKKSEDYCYAIKIEPHANGPLFVERTFYVRNAQKESIKNWMKEKNLTTFGMPTFFGNGSMEYEGNMYRYLVLERYGKDIWSLFKQNNRRFPVATVFQLGLQMIDVLEYIHHQGYVHADIKGANMLLGRKKGTENQAYLVDYGLACRAALDKEFKPDPKCAHNGTIEYTSRDAHLGVATMRGDLEILGYNMVQWIAGELPWEKDLKNPKRVQELKEAFMKNVRAQCKAMNVQIPEQLIKYMEYLNTLKPKEVPDYDKCRQFFDSYLKKVGKTRSSKLEFKTTGKSCNDDKVSDSGDVSDKASKASDSSATKPKRGRKAAAKKVTPDEDANDSEEVEDEEVTKKKLKRSPSRVAKAKSTKKSAAKTPELDDDEPQESPRAVRNKKRKSSEPALLVKIKKTKLAPKATPPAKKNHINTATQTSVEKRQSPRHVSFDSPISVDIESKHSSVNSSGDIFDDTFEIQEKKVKPKKKLLSKEEVIVKKVVKKKTTVKSKESKSWKDQPTVANGRSPPK